MTETNMPAVEAVVETGNDPMSYELAFHILPTIAEGEVKTVFDAIKAQVAKLGGTLKEEEVPARFDLAYDIVKFLEGRNRKFTSAYFGWVRFNLEANKVAEVNEMMEGSKDVLRFLLIRLDKTEEVHPFYFHPAIADRVVETIIVEAEEVAVVAPEVEEEVAVVAEVAETEEKVEDGGEVKEAV